MRILITSIVDLKRVTHNRIHVFADYLSRRHDVTVLCLDAWWLEKSETDDGRAGYHSDSYFRELFERTRILYLSQGRRPAVLQELTSLRTLDGLLREIDLASFDVHVNYCNLVAGYFVARKAKRIGIPTVLDIADDLPHSFARSPRVPRVLRTLAKLGARGMLASNVRLARKVTFVTQALGDAYHLPHDKAVLIPNGFHEELLERAPSQGLKKDLGIEQAFVLGFVGTLLPWVDLEPTFDALRSICADGKDIRMLVVGGGEKLQESVALADAYGIADRVIFTNHVPLSEVPQYISCMDVCLIPRTATRDSDRSLPLKLFEYMACRKPVISTPLAGVREAVGDRVLYAQEGGEFAGRITELYLDEDLRGRLGIEGSEFVRRNYAWEQICRRLEGALIETAGQSPVAVSS